MDDQNKNLILATVLSFVVILLWYTVFAPPAPVVPPVATDATSQTAPVAATPTVAAAVPDAGVAATAAATTELAAAPRIAIATPRLSGSISLLGGRIDDLSLVGYRETLAADSPAVRLLAPVGGTDLNAAKPYYAVYGWSPAGGLDAAAVPNARTLWTAPADATLAPGKPVTLTWDNGAGLTFTRQISVDDNYLFTVTQSVTNATAAPVRLAPYGIVARHGIPNTRSVYVLHEGAVRMSDGKLQELKYKDITKLDTVQAEGPADVVTVTENGWTGFTDKYWMTTLAPMPGQSFTSVVKYVPGSDIYQTEARMPVLEVAPGATASTASMLFAGAKEWETIRAYRGAAPRSTASSIRSTGAGSTS